jgi:HlyD family secretion protein
MSRIRALERAKAELEGQRGQYSASVAQTGEAAGESRLQVMEAQSNYQDRVASESREVEASLNDVLPRLNAARDQLTRTEIRSPARGVIVGLTVFTPGGVIAPGQKLMDVVPDEAPLLIEARISPADADDLKVGQQTFVRFDTLHERSLPNLRGTLSRISADSFTDERTGEQFFTAEVTVPHSQLSEIQKRRGADFALRAGMPVQVQIPTRKRTALQYAFEPITDAFWKAFRES